MNSQSFLKGSKIFVASDINFTMGLIISGRVAISIGKYQIVLSPGDIVGVLDFAQNTYSFEYVALSDVEMIPYIFNEQKGLWSLLQSDDKLLVHLFRSFRSQIGELMTLLASSLIPLPKDIWPCVRLCRLSQSCCQTQVILSL